MLLGSITETIVRNRMNQNFPFGPDTGVVKRIAELVEEHPDDLVKARENAAQVREILIWEQSKSSPSLSTKVTKSIYADINRSEEVDSNWF